MEKQGMGRKRRLLRAGLLVAALLLPRTALLSQDGSEGEGNALDEKWSSQPVGLRVETSPAVPSAQGEWTLTIFIDHPMPGEVTIRPPDFPPALALEKIRTEPVLPEPDDPALRMTKAEYVFTLKEAGIALIPAFEVIAPGKRSFTDAITLQIREISGGSMPRFRWEGAPASLALGETGEVTLRLSGGGEENAPERLLQGRAPANAVVEELPSEEPGLYRFLLIPLDGRELVLGPWDIVIFGVTTRIPRLAIPVTAANPAGVAPAQSGLPGEDAARDSLSPEDSRAAVPAFPEMRESAFFRGAYRKTARAARALWETGRRAEAVALVRRAERKALTGFAFFPLREAMEKSLGVETAPAVPWAALWFLLPLAFFAGALFAGLRFREKIRLRTVTIVSPGGFRYIAVLVFCLVLGALLAGLWRGGGKDLAVMKETAGYRAPEEGALVIALFDEGQRVRARFRAGDWVYVETPDRRAGWTKKDNVLYY
jgi:hypothetical protein